MKSQKSASRRKLPKDQRATVGRPQILSLAEVGIAASQAGDAPAPILERRLSHQARFEAATGSPEVDWAAFYRDFGQIEPADRLYTILFTPRSGSTWLRSVLSKTGLLGIPDEYINPEFLPGVAKAMNSRDPDGLFQMLRRKTKTKNGVFGLKTRSNDIEAFGEEVFLRVMDDTTTMFNLWREDMVAQAISLWRAVKTNHYHWVKGGEAPPLAPSYNAEELAYWLRHVIQIENDNITFLKRAKRPFVSISYENIIKSRDDTVAMFYNALHVDAPVMTEDEHNGDDFQKISKPEDAAIADRFREDRGNLIANLESKRVIRHEPDGVAAFLAVKTAAVNLAAHLPVSAPPPTCEPPQTDLLRGPDLVLGAAAGLAIKPGSLVSEGEADPGQRLDPAPGGEAPPGAKGGERPALSEGALAILMVPEAASGGPPVTTGRHALEPKTDKPLASARTATQLMPLALDELPVEHEKKKPSLSGAPFSYWRRVRLS